MNNWTYLPTEIEEDLYYWVACKTKNGCVVCLAYHQEGEWYFADDMLACWKDEPLDENGFEPYAVMWYDIPKAPQVK